MTMPPSTSSQRRASSNSSASHSSSVTRSRGSSANPAIVHLQIPCEQVTLARGSARIEASQQAPTRLIPKVLSSRRGRRHLLTDVDIVAAYRCRGSGHLPSGITVVSQWYHAGMGMTLRTSEKQTEALRRQALAEGRSMQAVALSAIDEYIERRAHQTEVNAVLDKVIERERGVLRRLAET